MDNNTFSIRKVSIVIQAGGKSSRMGRDKAFVQFRGKPLIQHLVKHAQELGEDVIIIANALEKYNDLTVPVHPDLIKNVGPLGGLYTGLMHAKYDRVLVLAVDMPIMNYGLIDYMLKISKQGYDIVVPVLDGEDRYEPLRAVYSKKCLPFIKADIDQGKRRMISFFPHLKVRKVTINEIKKFDPQLISFTNVNTEEDLSDLEKFG